MRNSEIPRRLEAATLKASERGGGRMTAIPQTAATRPVRVTDLHRMKAERQRIVMTTCYDTLFAKLLDECGVQLRLIRASVGEGVGCAGWTDPGARGMIIYNATAVCRGVRRALVVCD